MSGPFACRLCGAAGAIAMPTDIAVREVRCAACGRAQLVNHYASGAQQLFEEVARIQAAKADREQKRRDGVTCGACGGAMALPADPLAVSFACPFCARSHLVTDFVDPKLVANERLAASVRDKLDEVRATSARETRTALWLALAIVGLIGAVFVAVFALAR